MLLYELESTIRDKLAEIYALDRARIAACVRDAKDFVEELQ